MRKDSQVARSRQVRAEQSAIPDLQLNPEQSMKHLNAQLWCGRSKLEGLVRWASILSGNGKYGSVIELASDLGGDVLVVHRALGELY